MGHSVNNQDASCTVVAICFILAREKCCNNLFLASLLWMSSRLDFINQGLFNYVIKVHRQDDSLPTQQNCRALMFVFLCVLFPFSPRPRWCPWNSRRVSPPQPRLSRDILTGVRLLSLVKLIRKIAPPLCVPLSVWNPCASQVCLTTWTFIFRLGCRMLFSTGTVLFLLNVAFL